ncbi:hypothetical protein F5880DRAFT_1505266, partial [Lentinula raphanica]
MHVDPDNLEFFDARDDEETTKQVENWTQKENEWRGIDKAAKANAIATGERRKGVKQFSTSTLKRWKFSDGFIYALWKNKAITDEQFNHWVTDIRVQCMDRLVTRTDTKMRGRAKQFKLEPSTDVELPPHHITDVHVTPCLSVDFLLHMFVCLQFSRGNGFLITRYTSHSTSPEVRQLALAEVLLGFPDRVEDESGRIKIQCAGGAKRGRFGEARAPEIRVCQKNVKIPDIQLQINVLNKRIQTCLDGPNDIDLRGILPPSPSVVTRGRGGAGREPSHLRKGNQEEKSLLEAVKSSRCAVPEIPTPMKNIRAGLGGTIGRGCMPGFQKGNSAGMMGTNLSSDYVFNTQPSVAHSTIQCVSPDAVKPKIGEMDARRERMNGARCGDWALRTGESSRQQAARAQRRTQEGGRAEPCERGGNDEMVGEQGVAQEISAECDTGAIGIYEGTSNNQLQIQVYAEGLSIVVFDTAGHCSLLFFEREFPYESISILTREFNILTFLSLKGLSELDRFGGIMLLFAPIASGFRLIFRLLLRSVLALFSPRSLSIQILVVCLLNVTVFTLPMDQVSHGSTNGPVLDDIFLQTFQEGHVLLIGNRNFCLNSDLLHVHPSTALSSYKIGHARFMNPAARSLAINQARQYAEQYSQYYPTGDWKVEILTSGKSCRIL